MKTTPSPQPAYGPYIATRQPMSRRHFLRGVGVALSLPLLNAMLPTFGRAQQGRLPAAPATKPRRMFTVITNMGMLGENLFPAQAGRNYVATPYLEVLAAHRNDLTVFSGVSLPGVGNGHKTQESFITGAPGAGSVSFQNTISLDQIVAHEIGYETRFPSLALTVNGSPSCLYGSPTLSFDQRGDPVRSEPSATEVYRQLFVNGTRDQSEAEIQRLATGRSILDTLIGQVNSMERDLNPRDRDRVDQYLTSVRELERRMQVAQSWERKPKPIPKTPPPMNLSPTQLMEKIRIMFELTKIAFETDSTRAVTLFISGDGTPGVNSPLEVEIKDSYHGLSHHGKVEDKLAQLRALDLGQLRELNRLLGNLKAAREDGETLLDRTMVLFGSNLGDGNTHSSKNLPIIFAGGGFKHGQHLAFNTERNYPLTNLHLSMLHRMGIAADKFASSTGTMPGLEMT